MIFFSKSSICFLIDLEQMDLFDKGSLDILSLFNVKI